MDRIAQLLATEDPWRGPARALGALLVGTGLILIYIRRTAFADPWGDVALLAVLVIAFAFLYGVGMLGARTAERAPWQDVALVFGVLVAPLALLQLVDAVGGNPGAPLNVAWVFLAAAVAAAGAVAAGVRYGLLLASVALVVAWLALWHELLSGGVFDEPGRLRVLLLAAGIGLGGVAAAAWMFGEPEDRVHANELLTGAALAIVGAGAVSVFASVGPLLFPRLNPEPTLFWNGYLLVTSLAAIALAAALALRGLAYVGALGLAIFLFVVGFQFDGSDPSGSVAGWPLVALGLGLVAFIASIVRLVEVPDEPDRAGGGDDAAPDGDDAGATAGQR